MTQRARSARPGALHLHEPMPASTVSRPMSEQAEPRELVSGRARRVLVVGLLVLPVVLAVSADFPLCPTAGLFGIPCPGCGLTRATLTAFSGQFSQAMAYHPLVFVVGPVYLAVMGGLGLSYIRGSSSGAPSRRMDVAVTALAIILFALLFGVWIARFLGAFGGPVPVETVGGWWSAR